MNGYVIGLVILILLVLAASAAASVIRDIDYKRQVSGKRQFCKLEDGKRIPHDLRETAGRSGDHLSGIEDQTGSGTAAEIESVRLHSCFLIKARNSGSGRGFEK